MDCPWVWFCLSLRVSVFLKECLSLSLWPCLVHIVILSAHWPCLVHIAFLSGCGIIKRIADGKLAIVACLAMLIARVLQCLSLCLYLSFTISLSLKKNLAWHCPALALFISCFCRTFMSLVCMSLVCIGGHVSGSVCVCVLEVLAKLVFSCLLACLLICNCWSVLILLACFLPCFLACRKHHDHKWPEKWSDLMTQVCWPACCFALLGLIKSPLSLALCASWSAWFDQEISLYVYIYISICIYLCWLQGWSSSPLMVQRKQVCCFANCKCCIVFNCLVKSASVHICFLLLSSGLSLYIHIYIYGLSAGQCRPGPVKLRQALSRPAWQKDSASDSLVAIFTRLRMADTGGGLGEFKFLNGSSCCSCCLRFWRCS